MFLRTVRASVQGRFVQHSLRSVHRNTASSASVAIVAAMLGSLAKHFCITCSRSQAASVASRTSSVLGTFGMGAHSVLAHPERMRWRLVSLPTFPGQPRPNNLLKPNPPTGFVQRCCGC